MHPVRTCGIKCKLTLASSLNMLRCILWSCKCVQSAHLSSSYGDPLWSFTVFIPSTNFVTWHADLRGLRKYLFCKGSEYLSHFSALCEVACTLHSSSRFALVFPSLIWSPVEAIHADLCILHQFLLSQGLTLNSVPECLGDAIVLLGCPSLLSLSISLFLLLNSV